jgi:GNAT superfamily N-acetyltransferase
MDEHSPSNALTSHFLGGVHRLQFGVLVGESLQCPDRKQLTVAAETDHRERRIEKRVDVEGMDVRWRAVRVREREMPFEQRANIIDPWVFDGDSAGLHGTNLPVTDIRAANVGDLVALGDIYRRAAWSNVGDRPLFAAHPEYLDRSDQWIDGGRVRVAVSGDGSIAGFATTVLRDGWLELEDLFVAPEWMRHGIGRVLIADAIEVARQCGAAYIEVSANPHADAFYRDVGFHDAGAHDAGAHDAGAKDGDAGLRMRLDVH